MNRKNRSQFILAGYTLVKTKTGDWFSCKHEDYVKDNRLKQLILNESWILVDDPTTEKSHNRTWLHLKGCSTKISVYDVSSVTTLPNEAKSKKQA